MLTLAASTRVFLHRGVVDFRKSHDGLAAVVRAELAQEPLSGALFVFINRRRDRVKLLQWDGNGLWLHYKRLERGTFRAITFEPRSNGFISRAELAMLLEGIDVRKGKIRQRFADTIRIPSREDSRAVDQQPRA